MRPSSILLFLVLVAAPAGGSTPAEQDEALRSELASLEVESHQRWRDRDMAALSSLMDEDYRFVVMNGMIERREEILGLMPTGTSNMTVRSFSVHPQEVLVRDGTAVVISELRIDATARGRQLPGLMRILSTYTRAGDEWKLLARSITPTLQQPEAP